MTRLLAEAGAGDREALERLAEVVLEELRGIASRVLRAGRPGQTLRTTALVHEAWLRLSPDANQSYEGRTHFLRIAARAMRSVLVDYARARGAAKRAGGLRRVELDEALEDCLLDTGDILDLEEALSLLERRFERQARVVELRFFTGLSIAETAGVLGVSHGTVETDWRLARAWLHRELHGDLEP